MPWDTSRRAQHIPAPRRQQRKDNARILKEHRGICHWCGGAGADEVDHITPLAEGGPHHPSNLAPIHSEPCHKQKTQAEAQRARVSRRRQEPKHPGLI